MDDADLTALRARLADLVKEVPALRRELDVCLIGSDPINRV